MLNACHLTRQQMPALFEGSDITGTLLPEVASAWGMPAVPVVAGGGDNAAGAVGVGMIDAGQAMLSLGTSGVYFAVSDGFLSKPESAVQFLPCAAGTLAFNVCDVERRLLSGLGG